MLKISAFYLEKQKSFIPKKYIFIFSRTAKIHPKDGVSRLNFQEGFDSTDSTMHAALNTMTNFVAFCPKIMILFV